MAKLTLTCEECNQVFVWISSELNDYELPPFLCPECTEKKGKN